MVNTPKDRWEAPGALEAVRRFLNTWDLSLRDRVFVDRLPGLARDRRAWRSTFPDLTRPRPGELPALVDLRADLRALVEEGFNPEVLNAWLRRVPIRVRVEGEETTPRLQLAAAPGERTGGRVLTIVLEAIAQDTWPRLRACPDCRLVFFDATRNRSKVWCGMYAGPGGRACGSIAKVRRWRQRQRSDAG